MKKSMIIGMVSLLAINNANALEVRPFIGGNLAINGVVWDDTLRSGLKEDIGVLPAIFAGAGIEGGVRFATDNIYNAGITLAGDYLFESEVDLNEDMEDYISSIDTSFAIASVTFDNYLRVSGTKEHRRDIVLGFGVANITEWIHLDPTRYGKNSGLEEERGHDNGSAIVLKIGYNHQIAKKLDWYVNGRAFIAPSKESDFDAMFNASVGLRFVF